MLEFYALILLACFFRALGFFALASQLRKTVGNEVFLGLLLTGTFILFLSAPMAEFGMAGPTMRDVLFGFFQGVLVFTPLLIAQEILAAGARQIDLYRGAQFSEQVSPLSGEQNSVLEGFAYLAAITSFFLLDLHFRAFEVLSKFSAFPSSIGPELWKSFASQILGLIESSSLVFFYSLILAAPGLVACLLFDLAAGFFSKTVPGVNINFEAIALKLVIGLIAIFLSIYTGLAGRVFDHIFSSFF